MTTETTIQTIADSGKRLTWVLSQDSASSTPVIEKFIEETRRRRSWIVTRCYFRSQPEILVAEELPGIPAQSARKPKLEKPPLSKSEKRARDGMDQRIAALIESVDADDATIASILKVQKTRVSRIRKKLTAP